MNRTNHILLRGFILFALVLAGLSGLRSLVLRVENYRPPLEQPTPPGPAAQPLVPQTVMVVVEGLTQEAAQEMPTLSALKSGRPAGTAGQARGVNAAFAVARAVTPSRSLPAWATLVSGAAPELSGAPLFHTSPDRIKPLPAGHLFGLARQAGMVTAFAGHETWAKLVGPAHFDYSAITAQRGEQIDHQTMTASLDFLGQRPNLLVIQLGQVDQAGEAFGAQSPEYAQAVQRVDRELSRLIAGLDLRLAVLVVTSTHGHLPLGGRGGDEPAVVRVPLILAGQAVQDGDFGSARQEDIAPTISALLGLPLPGINQGDVLTGMLRLTRQIRAELALAQAQQRIGLAQAYLPRLLERSLSPTAQGDLAVAQSSMEVANYPSALRLAELARIQVTEELAQARREAIDSRRQRVLPLALAAVIVPAYLLRHGRLRLLRAHLVAALLTLATFHLLFLRLEGPYSLSLLTERADLVRWAAWAGLSTLPGLIWTGWIVWRGRQPHPERLVQAVYGHALVIAYFVLLGLTILVQQHDPTLSWYLPPARQAFLGFLLGIEGVVTLAALLVGAWPAAVVFALVQRVAAPARAAAGRRLRVPGS